jgi:hypothetical protein
MLKPIIFILEARKEENKKKRKKKRTGVQLNQ